VGSGAALRVVIADDSYLVAVQWHPEALTDNDARTRHLFSDFIEAGSEWRRSHS